MTLEEARKVLELGLTATRQEIRAAYRRLARRWHPDRAPSGEEAAFRARMQKINSAYKRLREFLERYRYRLEEIEPPAEDYQEWWHARFGTGVWGPPPREPEEGKD